MAVGNTTVGENQLALHLQGNHYMDAEYVVWLIHDVVSLMRQTDQFGPEAKIEIASVKQGSLTIILSIIDTAVSIIEIAKFAKSLAAKARGSRGKVADALAMLMSENSVTAVDILTIGHKITVAKREVLAVQNLEERGSVNLWSPDSRVFLGPEATPGAETAMLSDGFSLSDRGGQPIKEPEEPNFDGQSMVGYFRGEGDLISFQNTQGKSWRALKSPSDNTVWPTDVLVLVGLSAIEALPSARLIRFHEEVLPNLKDRNLRIDPANDRVRITFTYQSEPFDISLSRSAIAALQGGRAPQSSDGILRSVEEHFEKIAGLAIAQRLDPKQTKRGLFEFTSDDLRPG